MRAQVVITIVQAVLVVHASQLDQAVQRRTDVRHDEMT